MRTPCISNLINGAYWAGFSLFLGLMIDRQHYYTRELILLRTKNLETAKKLNQNDEQPRGRGEEQTKKAKVK